MKEGHGFISSGTESVRLTGIRDMSFEAFTAVMHELEVFWVVTPCGVVV